MRDIPSEVLEILASRAIHLEYLLDLQWTSQTLRLWSGRGNLAYSGNTYQGNGWFLDYSNIKATFSTQASGIQFTLSGIPEELIALILSESYTAYTGRLYFAFFDEDETLIHAESEFFGFLDSVDIDEGPDDSAITLAYENQLIMLRNPREPRWTDASHQANYPSDLGFQYVSQIKQQRLYWGRPDTTRSF